METRDPVSSVLAASDEQPGFKSDAIFAGESGSKKSGIVSAGCLPPSPPARDKGEGGKQSRFALFARETAELIGITLVLLIAIRYFLVEARYIPSSSMEPTLQIGDRLLVEKVSGHLHQPIARGDIIVFYPPPSEMGGKDLSPEPLAVFARLSGLPLLPYEPAFIKRVIGLPHDRIRVEKGVGVFVNDQLLDESSYIKELPAYDMNCLGDIGVRNFRGLDLRPYKDANRALSPVIVPAGHLFVMGDNRNNSEDSHAWGFLDEKRVIGRAWLLFWRHFQPQPYHEIESGAGT